MSDLAKLKVKDLVEKALEFKAYSADADVKASTTAIEFLCDAVMGLSEQIGDNKTEILKLRKQLKK